MDVVYQRNLEYKGVQFAAYGSDPRVTGLRRASRVLAH